MPRVEQAETVEVSLWKVMRSPAFRRGFAEKRAGRGPSYDQEEDYSSDIDDIVNDGWDYERGRQFAIFAPRNMQIMLGGQVNPKAAALFLRLYNENAIT